MPASRHLLLTAVLLAGAALGGCSRDGFPDRRAEVDVDGRRIVYEFDEGTCGLDEDTIFLLGRASDGGVLQAVVGLDDAGDADPAASGVTVSDGSSDLGAFGPEAWERRGGVGDPPGEVRDVGLRGARIRLEGSVRRLDSSGVPVDGAEPVPIDLDARCDEADDGPTSP